MHDDDLDAPPATARGWSRRTIATIVVVGLLLIGVMGAGLALLLQRSMVSEDLSPADRDVLVTLADLAPALAVDPEDESWLRLGGTPLLRQLRLDYHVAHMGDELLFVHCAVTLDADPVSAAAGWTAEELGLEHDVARAEGTVKELGLEGVGDEVRYFTARDEDGDQRYWLLARTGTRRMLLTVSGGGCEPPEDPAAFFAPHVDKLRDYRP